MWLFQNPLCETNLDFSFIWRIDQNFPQKNRSIVPPTHQCDHRLCYLSIPTLPLHVITPTRGDVAVFERDDFKVGAREADFGPLGSPLSHQNQELVLFFSQNLLYESKHVPTLINLEGLWEILTDLRSESLFSRHLRADHFTPPPMHSILLSHSHFTGLLPPRKQAKLRSFDADCHSISHQSPRSLRQGRLHWILKRPLILIVF